MEQKLNGDLWKANRENIQLVEHARLYSLKHKKSSRECNKSFFTQHRLYVRIEENKSLMSIFDLHIDVCDMFFSFTV